VKKVLNALGAKWDRKLKEHIFDYDITETLKQVIETGVVVDWKKSTDFFFTPDQVVFEMLGLVNCSFDRELLFLEPSAGQGHILDLAVEEFPNARFFCIEENPLHCERLKEKGYDPICCDFLAMKPEFGPFDLILMNPPFSAEMEHIRHAYDFLSRSGQMITVASKSILTKQAKANQEFAQWFQEVGGYWYPLPSSSFKESGTSVMTQLLVITKEYARVSGLE